MRVGIGHKTAIVLPMLISMVLCMSLAGSGQVAVTDLGGAAPELANVQWMDGPGLRLSNLKGKSVCVVDFFRTWYPPCRFQLLDEWAAQKELGGAQVAFIGLTDEPAWQVQALREELPREFVWHIGLDRNDANLRALIGLGADADLPLPAPMPCTMVVDRAGRVAYLGPPPEDLGGMLRQVLAGTWDIGRVLKLREDEKLLAALRAELKSLPPGRCGTVVALADRIARLELPGRRAGERAGSMRDAAEKLLEDPACRGAYDAQALRYARLGAEGRPWYGVYETLGKALFRTGSLKEAVLAQKKAVDIVGDDGIRARLKEELAEYAAALAGKTGETVDLGGPAKSPAQSSAGAKPDAPPSELSAAQAVEDLESLHTILLNGYAGYDDFEWKLRLSGSSWKDRLKSFQDRASGRRSWPTEGFFALAADSLQPIVDEHFYIEAPASEGRERGRRQKFTVRYTPYFTDLRVVAEGGRMVVRSADAAHKELVGLEVRDVPVVTVPLAALDRPFLFPTVPGSGDGKEYLLGVFLSEPPGEARPFVFHAKDASATKADLTIHRGRVKDPEAGRGEAWSLHASGDTPLPVLKVRTAVEDKFSVQFLKSAETLRPLPAAVLDLRANLGGSDTVAMDWCGLICPQAYLLGSGNSIVGGGPGSVSRRWNPMSLGRPYPLAGPEGRNPGRETFRGMLFVVIDANTASSGETFAGLARQIPGEVLVGENSRGCSLYGNADIVKKLPVSRIAVRFGWTRFNWAGVFPIREGVGFFPDYWIDEPDPYPALARLAAMIKPGGVRKPGASGPVR